MLLKIWVCVLTLTMLWPRCDRVIAEKRSRLRCKFSCPCSHTYNAAFWIFVTFNLVPVQANACHLSFVFPGPAWEVFVPWVNLLNVLPISFCFPFWHIAKKARAKNFFSFAPQSYQKLIWEENRQHLPGFLKGWRVPHSHNHFLYASAHRQRHSGKQPVHVAFRIIRMSPASAHIWKSTYQVFRLRLPTILFHPFDRWWSRFLDLGRSKKIWKIWRSWADIHSITLWVLPFTFAANHGLQWKNPCFS